MRGFQSHFSSRSKGKEPVNPKITIRVDELIKKTYSGIITGKIKSLVQEDVPHSNQLLVEYIHEIYKGYDIQDPYRKYGSGSAVRPSSIMLQSRDKDKSNYSNSTGRNESSITHRPTQILGRSKQKIIRLKERGIQGFNFQNSILSRVNRDSEQSRHSTASIRKKIMYITPETNKIRVLDSMHTQNSHRGKGDNTIKIKPFQEQQLSISTTRIMQREIPSIYRYCIGCESTILEANIKFHETTCKELRQIFLLSFQQILVVLNRKINRIKKGISQIVSHENQPCREIKTRVKRWLSTLEQNQGKSISNFDQEYQSIQKTFYCESVNLMELTHRLRWFLRIREQLKGKFNL